MPDSQTALLLHDVHKSYAATPALRGVSLTVAAGEIVVLLGPSGCGKTTLLRIIAGLEVADSGAVRWRGQDVGEIPVHRRGFGLVFQDYALFPHKSVAQNVVFGLRMHAWEQPASEARLAEVLSLVGLSGYEERLIHELSGGEQQRVALARALAPAPALLLMDEPLGALDRALRERLMSELRTILKAGRKGGKGITAVYVTHDQGEAFAIADRIAIMSAGEIVQLDDPMTLYRRPSTPFVARFLGMENIFQGERLAGQTNLLRTALGDLELAPQSIPSGLDSLTVLIRADAARLAHENEEAPNLLTGRLHAISFRGRYQLATLAIGESRLVLEFEQALRLPDVGTPLTVAIEPAGIHVLAKKPP